MKQSCRKNINIDNIKLILVKLSLTCIFMLYELTIQREMLLLRRARRVKKIAIFWGWRTHLSSHGGRDRLYR
jgi:hypothetical protein